jgi:hypothetical protein
VTYIEHAERKIVEQRAEIDRLRATNESLRAVLDGVGHNQAAEVVRLRATIAALLADDPALPNLGLATTRDLIEELTARIDVDYASGGGGLDYSTVGGRPGMAAVVEGER